MSVGTPARWPLSTSAFLTQSCSVCGVQPILAAIDVTAAQRDGVLALVIQNHPNRSGPDLG